jgi:hypothetical protein
VIRAAALLPALLLPALAAAAPDRVGLIVGSNDGGPDRAALWYAEKDADRVTRVLTEVGGFDPGSVEILRSPTAARLRTALATLERRARALAGGERPPFVLFYFSGHADPLGLRLGAERVPYAEISSVLGALPAGVRIAVIDACHSGALTQEKGASAAPLDFEVPRAGPADGVAILTSASAGEPAQESASIGGSYFTHHLTLGLRGPADGDGDGRVTLGEAFRFAYQRTLSATAGAGVPTQHPTYAMRVSGQDEVVLADLRAAPSALAFAAGPQRRFVVARADSGELLAEVDVGGRPVRLALPGGRYRLERTAPEPRRGGWVEVPALGAVAVEESALAPVATVIARAKGLEPGVRAYGELFAGTPALRRFGVAWGAGLGLRASLPWLSVRAGAGYEEKSVDDDGVRYDWRALSLSVAAGLELPLRRAGLQAGLQGTTTLAEQRFAAGATAGDVLWSAGPYAAAVLPLGAAWGLRMELVGSATRFRLNGEPVVRGTARTIVALERAF